MATPLPASIADLVAGLALGSLGPAAGNRVSLEGLVARATSDGMLGVAIEKLQAASLRVSSGPFALELGQLALNKLAAKVRIEDGKPRLAALEAESAELSGVKVLGPLAFPHAAAGSWALEPLAGADGAIRAKIVDAQLLFDADVTVPIREGRIAFNDATVEHVGPDSRMGVSRMGLYVDAPNGRSYLYQFPSTPVAGVEYEKRGALLGPWVTDRGSLQLQPFGEGMLQQPAGGGALGFTEQARQLLDRTSVSGEVRLGDGKLAAPGVQAELAGRAQGRNVVRLQSEAVGRGVNAGIASLSIRNALASALGWRCKLDEITGSLTLRLFAEGTQWRFSFEVASVKISGLRLEGG